jgi:hypothetical protein
MSGCHRCGTDVARDTVGVRDVCDRCHAYLHCCLNCDFYEPGAHNDCREPNTEVVADKEDGNFCDYFHLAAVSRAPRSQAGDARAKLEELFRKGK